jgi:hypothetical protein
MSQYIHIHSCRTGDLEVTVETCIQEAFGSNLGHDIVYTDPGFMVFRSPSRQILRLCHDRLFQNNLSRNSPMLKAVFKITRGGVVG